MALTESTRRRRSRPARRAPEAGKAGAAGLRGAGAGRRPCRSSRSTSCSSSRPATNDTIGAPAAACSPRAATFENVGRLLDNADAHFMRGLLNSVLVSGSVTLAVVLFSTLAGFAFAKLRFRGRNALLLVDRRHDDGPGAARRHPAVHPHGRSSAGSDELKAVIVPFLVTGFGVFMMRQYVGQAVSDELIEAARVDGCSTLRHLLERRAARGPAGRGGARAVHLHADLERLPLAALVLNQDQPTVQVALGTLASRLLHRLRLSSPARCWRRCRCSRVRPVRPADHRRHHGRRAQGMTERPDSTAPATAAGGGLPGRLPLGRRHRGLPDRGRGRRRTAAARPSGTPSATRPGGSAAATPATSPSTTTTATARTSR